MQVLNVNALITGYEAVGDHTEFVVQISCTGALWFISRRFSDFDQLNTRLVRNFGDLIEARLPEKQWFGRFDSGFLRKRQVALGEYLESLLQVPGILEDASLQHFLELESHIDIQDFIIGPDSSRNNARQSGLLNENDRLSAIVDNAAQTFIDVSEIPEPLEAEQALQRKREIVQASQTLIRDQHFVDSFASSVQALQLPTPPVAHFSCDDLVARLQAETVDRTTYSQERDFLREILESVDPIGNFQILPPSIDLLAVLDVSLLPSSAAATAANTDLTSSFHGDRESLSGSGVFVSA